MIVIFNSEKLKQLRVKNSLSIPQLRKAINATSGHLDRLESGEYKSPRLDIVFKLAFYFNVSIEEFCKIENNNNLILTKIIS